jgi:hexulose-6-phosphate isomerase
MLKGMTYWSLEGGLDNTASIEHALETAKNENFQALELGVGPEGVITPQTSQAECEQIREQIDKAGVTVETVASGLTWGWSPTSDDPETREKGLQAHEGALQVAAWLGCQALLYIPGVVTSPINPAETVRYDLAEQRAKDGIKRLLETAEKVNVDLCLENVWNGLWMAPTEMAQVVDEFKSDRLGIYFDMANGLRYHQYPPHWVEMLGQRIKRAHIKDFDQSKGTLEGFCDIFEGDVPIEATMQALKRIGYDRTLVAEMIPYIPGQLSKASKAMDQVLQMA